MQSSGPRTHRLTRLDAARRLARAIGTLIEERPQDVNFCPRLPNAWRVTAAIVAFLVAALASLPIAAQAPANPVRREILVLYDGREESVADNTRVHRFAEMPLNHLGFVTSYWDVRKGLPDEDRLADARGVLTWFMNEQPRDLFAWLQDAAARGLRIVILGEGGYPNGSDFQNEANRLFSWIGFEFAGAPIDLTYATRVVDRDGMIGFERDLDPVLPQYPLVNVVGADVTPHLTLERRETNARTTTTVVLTSPRGGFAATGYFQYDVPGTEISQWIVDPFAFFTAAFGPLAGPIPDTTTLSGRRIYFSHIDGDGWNNPTRIAGFRDQQQISAEVVGHELIEAYPDLPVTVGVIGADVDPRYGNVVAAQKVARALFALPQVEVATHTYTHPFQWPFFEKYDRAREDEVLGKREAPWTSTMAKTARSYAERLFPGLTRDRHHDETVIADQDPPRAFSDFPFDLDFEIAGAIASAEQFAPSGKRAAVYLWSGDADPFAEAIARTRRLGVRNLNGGDSRIDAAAPSISYIAPISRPVGSERQIYAPNANDYVFMSDDNGRQFGFLYLGKTIEATESPRRLKPIDVYYHMYVGERSVELNAVRRHLDHARSGSLAPITASQYAAIADGFFSTTISQIDASTWQVSNRGDLQTVRFDDAGASSVDFGKSVGVLGQEHKESTLYVALDPAIDDAIVALSPSDQVQQRLPYLISSRWQFSNLERLDCGFTASTHGFGTGEMKWAGLAAGRYTVRLRTSNGVSETDAMVDGAGILTLALKADAIDPARFEASCRN
jgi:hypothetical protein